MKTRKIISYLGFAAKSRNLITGTNTTLLSMEKGRLKLLIICEDIGENTRKKLIAKAVSTRTKYRIYGESSELGRAVGKEGRGVIGIVDNNFAQVITKEIDNDNLDR